MSPPAFTVASPVSLILLSLRRMRQYISQLSVHLVRRCLDCTSWLMMTSVSAERKGPFTHAIFDAISDAISRAKRALPYPARMLFSRSIVWIGKKVITYCLKTPFIPISANLVVFCRSVTRLKTRAGLAGAGFVHKTASKSHRNRMCKRALIKFEIAGVDLS